MFQELAPASFEAQMQIPPIPHHLFRAPQAWPPPTHGRKRHASMAMRVTLTKLGFSLCGTARRHCCSAPTREIHLRRRCFHAGIIGITVESVATVSHRENRALDRTMRILNHKSNYRTRSILRMNAERTLDGVGTLLQPNTPQAYVFSNVLTYPAPTAKHRRFTQLRPLPSRFSNLRQYSVPAARQEPARSTQQTSARSAPFAVKCH